MVAIASGSAAQPSAADADAVAQRSADTLKVIELKIERMAREGRCLEALPEIEHARMGAPRSVRLAMLEGQCQLQLFDYVNALESFEEVEALDPELEDAALYRAIAQYHSEDFEGAEKSIGAAKGHVSYPAMAQYELYSGLLLLNRNDYRPAALAFERARMADAAQVEPVASFYAGLAWQSLSERDLAREAFERVVDVDRDGAWGIRAAAALDSAGLEERNWVSLRAGLEYDSNVVLLGEGLPVPQGISDEDDGRFSYFLDGGVELFREGRWSGGIRGSYAGGVNFRLREFDTQYPIASLWLDRGIGERSLIRATYSLGYAWVDYSPFVTTQSAILSYFHSWESAGNTELALGWEWNDYHFDIPFVPAANPDGTCPNVPGFPLQLPCSPPNVNSKEARNRDGNGLRLALVHRYDLLSGENEFFRTFTLRGGYAFRRYFAKGTDWDFMGHEFLLGFNSHLPFELNFDVQGGFTYQPFDSPSSYPDPPVQAGQQYYLSPEDRLDKIWSVQSVLERPLTDWASVSARYDYIRNISNVDVFDYSRHVIGGFVTLTY